MHRRSPLCGAAGLLAGTLLACTWVPLTSGGEDVRVARPAAVAECQKLGRTTSKTADRVVIFARTERKMSQELQNLARNEAADMGGDTVVAAGPRVEGHQVFDVYRCRKP